MSFKIKSTFNHFSCFLIVLISLLSVSALPAYSSGTNFPVFDATYYKNKPDLTQYGMSPIKVIYTAELWDANDQVKDKPNFTKINETANKLDPKILTCIDIEHWFLTGKPAAEIDQNIDKLKQVAAAFRRASPSLSFGYYGTLPIRDFSRATKSRGMKQYDQWVRENAKLKPIANSVDVVFPSLYTLYTDPKGWEKYAIANLKEARKYGKPVYAFLWPEFHISSPLAGTTIPGDFWRLQLETCRKYADGIVIWGGYQENWDNNAAWWAQTREFLKAR